MAYKLILVQSDESYDDDLEVGEISVSDLADSDELKHDFIVMLRELLEKGDEDFLTALNNAGWVNRKSIKNREEKLVAAKKFFYSDADQMYGLANSRIQVRSINLDDMDGCVSTLADGRVQILQSITKSSLKKLMTPQQKKIYDAALKRAKNKKAKRAASLKKKQEASKAKEIAQAKKILKKAGELK